MSKNYDGKKIDKASKKASFERCLLKWWAGKDSNLQPSACKADDI